MSLLSDTLKDIRAAGFRVSITVRVDITLEPNENNIGIEVKATCDECGWSDTYDNPDSAARGLRLHKSRYCEKTLNVDWIRDMHSEDTQT